MPLRESYLKDDPLWYKDAVIYELHVKSFFDNNDDGIGDFKGLIKKLDYLQNLGVTAIWLLPFYPSPLKDDGYDIADYRSIHPQYGTLQDFKELLKEAHHRGIRVITELVLNHTSDHHRWFQKARTAKPGSSWRNFYVWSETPERYKDARIIFKDFETSNWTWDTAAKAYYWHRFYSYQPDLNFDNPRVQKEMLRAIDFWMAMGVDGLRLDAVPYLYEREGTNCENLPETHAFLKKLRAHIEKKFKNRMLLAEANQWSEDAMAYFGEGDESHMAFNFPVMPRMFMAVQMEDRFPVIDILDPPLEIPPSCQWSLFLRNHDELTLEMVTDEERDYMYRVYASDPRAKLNLGIRRRLAPLLGNNRRKIELMNILLFSLPGTPVIYYGDEIGMGDNYYLGDRSGVRTPMQWSSDRNAGFSRANPQKLFLPVIIDPEYHYEALNVENQESNLSSMLWWMKRVIAMRKRYKAFGRGDVEFISPHNPKVLVFIRRYQDEIILVVINLSRFSQVVELDLSPYQGLIPEEVFSRNEFPPIKETPYVLTLGPHNHFWFLLKREKGMVVGRKEKAFPSIHLKRHFKELWEGNEKERFEQDILIPYLRKCRWFGGKGRRIRSLIIREAAPLVKHTLSKLLILEVSYNEGFPEMYFLPLCYMPEGKSYQIRENSPQAIMASIRTGDEQGILYDGSYNKEFHHIILDMVLKRKKIKGTEGEFVVLPARRIKRFFEQKKLPLESSVLKVEQSNTSILYERTFMLKIFRRLEKGINPDVEMERFLTEKARFPHVPPYAGAVEYRGRKSGPISIGLLQGFVPNEGDAWVFSLDQVGRYFERVLSRRAELTAVPPVSSLIEDQQEKGKTSIMEELVDGFYSEMMELLGKRTGELHLSLSSELDDPEFTPESFSVLYQRSVYQSMRSLMSQVFRLVEGNIEQFSKDLREDLSDILASKMKILNRLKKIVGKKISAAKIRIHGDYHLGQVLFTGKDFVIIDFEGEPARALSERKLKRSPLRDVAGMVRSFHYAAYSGLLRHPSLRSEDRSFLEPWVKVWYHHTSRIFLRSYLQTVGDAEFLPHKKEELTILFEAFLLEKAVYELGYEVNNRPDWVIIPIRGIKYIL
ncbi:MAG: maltose alpha-D-glucosyltransferase [Candidatus Aminicenantes bacterium]